MTTIAATATRIADALNMDHDEALTLATTYAIQFGVQTRIQEGGQAPAVEISDGTADEIFSIAVTSADPEGELASQIRQQRAVQSWKSSIESGTPRSSLAHVEEDLNDAFPELGALYKTWQTLFTEDSRRHSEANSHRNPMLLDSGPAFTPGQETRDARAAYEAMLKEITQ